MNNNITNIMQKLKDKESIENFLYKFGEPKQLMDLNLQIY